MPLRLAQWTLILGLAILAYLVLAQGAAQAAAFYAGRSFAQSVAVREVQW